MELVILTILFILFKLANMFQTLVILAMSNDVVFGHSPQCNYMDNKGRVPKHNQLDLMDELFRYEEEEQITVKKWSRFLSNLLYTKTLFILNKEVQDNLSIRWTVDDMIKAAAICYHKMTFSQEPISEYVEKIQDVRIYTYNVVTFDQIQANVARLEVPVLPHDDSGIVLARKEVLLCISKLKRLLNDL